MVGYPWPAPDHAPSTVPLGGMNRAPPVPCAAPVPGAGDGSRRAPYLFRLRGREATQVRIVSAYQ
ncbi:hypothetical protein TPA0906_49490 [Streptomyces olivaceus]|nr:hypothetical protein TPA0906_49490 [Streptomyces olivaceus]